MIGVEGSVEVAGPLSDIRVIDLTNGPVGGIATMILADFGADVIKVERPGGDPFRFLANAPMWLRGKRSVELDLHREVERDRLFTLVETADVVITSYRGHAAVDLGCDYDVLNYRNAGLVYCQISGFGPYGPYVGYPGYEGVVAAKAGRMAAFAGLPNREGPAFAAVNVASHAAALGAVQGILAGLLARDRLGFGQYVETSMLQGLLPYELGGLYHLQLRRRGLEEFQIDPRADPYRMPTLNYHPVPTKDGRWIQLGNLLQHLFDNFLTATDLIDVYADPRAVGPPALWDEEFREEFRERMFDRMREKTADEWMQIFSEHGGVVAHPFQSTQEALLDPDMIENQHVIEVEDPRGPLKMKEDISVTEAALGYYAQGEPRAPMKELGLLAKLTATPGAIEGAIPLPGQHTLEVLGDGRQPWQPRPGEGEPQPALDGVTILEFATIIATPLGASMLADLGARVIKIEPIGGDPYRNMGSIGAIKTNASKESICLDLKSEEGQAVVRQLLEHTDVVIHNYRPGVPERLGIGYEDVKAIKPDIVYLQANGYGSDGPSAHRPSTHPIPGAGVGGALWQSGGIPETDETFDDFRETARRLFRANEVNPDPNTSSVIAASTLLALYALRASGEGQQVFVDMFGANAWANADDFVWYEGKEPRGETNADLFGTGPTYRLYECSEGWVFLGLVQEKEWQQFCRRIEAPELSIDPRFVTRESRAANAEELTALLSELFKTDTADAWEQLLAIVGLGCVRADGPVPSEFWLDDEHVKVNEYTTVSQHGQWGELVRHGPVTRTRRSPMTLGAGVLAGEDSERILGELGYDETAIADLIERGIVGALQGEATEA